MPDARSAESRRMAILIDGDNAQSSLIEKVVLEASKYGVVTIRRIYGDWTEPQMKGWKATMQNYAFNPVQQFRYTIGKNATDSAMIIDAMDVLYSGNIDGFCLGASDSDYTRLAMRIREKGGFVMGIGKQMTPRAFVNACDVFVFTENLVDKPAARERTKAAASAAQQSTGAAPASSAQTPATPSVQPALAEGGAQASGVRDFRELFSEAFDLAVGDNGWAFLSDVGTRLRQVDPSFDTRTYGFRQLTRLVAANEEWIELKRAKKKNGSAVMIVRLRATS